MRNLKKILAVICVIAMMASIAIVPALAATTFTYETEATTLNTIGMMGGMNLGDAVTRIQGITFAIQAAGKDAAAKALTDAEVAAALANVTDAANIPAWGLKYAAYAVLNGLTTGTDASVAPKVTFSPLQEVSGDSMLVWILKSMGYTTVGTADAWQVACTDAKVLSLTQGYAFHGKATLIRDDVAGILFGAAKNGVNKDGKAFIQSLIDAGFITAQAAADAGLALPPAPAALAVTDVSADNLVRVVVTFNKAIDGDSIDDGDFVVDGTDILADNVSLSDDKTVATLDVFPDLGNEMNNGDEISFEVSGITDASGDEIDDYTADFTPYDSAQPTVESIEFTGPTTAKLTFSEPLDDASATADVIIDDGIYSATPAAFDNTDEVSVDLGTELDEGSHSFKVKGFEDYAGYANLVKTINVTYTALDSAPGVTVKKATQSYVVLKFDRPVTGLTIADFYQTYSSWQPLELQNEDGDGVPADPTDTVRLVFTDAATLAPADDDTDDRPLPVGTAKIVVKDEAFEDAWGNKNDGDIVLSTEITADSTKPTITKITVESEKQLYVYFSEDVIAADAEDDGNYVIKDSDGDVISSTKWNAEDYNSDDKYVEINFNDNLDNGDYTIKAEAIADTSISANSLDTVTLSFTISDKSCSLDDTTVSWVDGSKIMYVKYGDTMATTGVGSVLDKNNYRLDGDKLGDSVKLTMFTSKIVKILFPSTADDYATSTLTIGQVKDAAGNQVKTLATDKTVKDEVAPVVTAIKKIADNKFELTVSQELKSISSGAITVDANGTGGAVNASYKYVNDGDDTTITITVPAAEKSAGTKAVTATYKIAVVATKITSVTSVQMAGKVFTAGAAGNGFNALDADVSDNYTDGVAPVIATDTNDDDAVYTVDADGNGYIDHVVMIYSENIDNGTVSKYTYSVDGYTVKYAYTDSTDAATDTTTAADVDTVAADVIATLTASGDIGDGGDGNAVVLTLTEGDDFDTDYTPTVTQLNDIQDSAAGNTLEPDEDGLDSVDLAGAQVVGAVASAAALADDVTITVSFSEAVDVDAMVTAGILVADDEVTQAELDTIFMVSGTKDATAGLHVFDGIGSDVTAAFNDEGTELVITINDVTAVTAAIDDYVAAYDTILDMAGNASIDLSGSTDLTANNNVQIAD